MPKKNTPKKTEPTPAPTAAPPKPKAKSKVDPEILAIRAKAREEIKQLQKTRNSGAVLKEIVERKLPRLTKEDLDKLRYVLTADESDAPQATPSENTPTPWPTSGMMMGED